MVKLLRLLRKIRVIGVVIGGIGVVIGVIRVIGGVGVIGVGEARAVSNAAGASTELRYWHTDHLGSVVAVSDETGQKVWEQRYLPFGGRVGEFRDFGVFGADQGNRGYTGQERDTEVGLYNYRARLYNPRIGSFVSGDRIGVIGEIRSIGENKYAYGRNNPLRFTDPSGNQPVFDPGVGGGGVIDEEKRPEEVIRPMTLEETLVSQWQQIGVPHWAARLLAKAGKNDVLGLFFTGLIHPEYRQEAHTRALDLFTERLMRLPFVATAGDINTSWMGPMDYASLNQPYRREGYIRVFHGIYPSECEALLQRDTVWEKLQSIFSEGEFRNQAGRPTLSPVFEDARSWTRYEEGYVLELWVPENYVVSASDKYGDYGIAPVLQSRFNEYQHMIPDVYISRVYQVSGESVRIIYEQGTGWLLGQ